MEVTGYPQALLKEPLTVTIWLRGWWLQAQDVASDLGSDVSYISLPKI